MKLNIQKLQESENIINAIDGLIFEKRSNTLSNHFKTWFKYDETHFYGNVKGNKFEIWRFAMGAQGSHPIIFGEVVNDRDNATVKLKPKMNPVGIYQLIFTTVLLSVFLYISIFSKAGGEGLSPLLSILLFFVLPTVIVRFVYRYETKAHLKQLMALIDKRTNKKQDYKVVIPAFL